MAPKPLSVIVFAVTALLSSAAPATAAPPNERQPYPGWMSVSAQRIRRESLLPFNVQRA